ncbi:MAG: ABC transporter permease [Candidatus Solibacter usitatus]|nr:ABC transporter permease [Candidatus Solibacter usitatus]
MHRQNARVRRDVLSRYRGSFGGVVWTVMHPLLLMVTYFLVFGIVLQSRFGNDPSRTGFALYFLAGMLPWLALNEPAARAPYVIWENRTFVKRLVFPVSVLPLNHAFSALVTSLLATAVFLCAVAVIKGAVPWTASLLPLLVFPLALFSLGLCWFLATAGVFVRDLVQVMTFLLTLWFFLTPICYEEAKIPVALFPWLAKNPMFQLVRFYRQILLEGAVPNAMAMTKVWVVSLAFFIGGYACFARCRKTFPDVV